jgi:hypothetical protein
MQFQYEDVLITCEQDLDKFTTAEMVDLHNQAGVDVKPVKKFENRAAGMRLTWAKLNELGKKCNFYAPPKPAKIGEMKKEKEPKPAPAEKVKEPRARRAGTKDARLVAMLKRPDGATIDEIMSVFGWLRHTCRGYIHGQLVTKRGYEIESTKVDNGTARGTRRYRIVTEQ